MSDIVEIVDEDDAVVELRVDYAAIIELGRKMYENNPFWIVPRELLQNSVDAHPTHIDVTLTKESDGTARLVVDDDGDGIQSFMKHFFTLGGSNKRYEGSDSVGGYGIGAKLSVMCSPYWSVESKNYFVDRNILLNHMRMIKKEFRTGCKVEVLFAPSDVPYSYMKVIKRLLENTVTTAEVYLNGTKVEQPELTQIVLPNDQELTKLPAWDYGMCGDILVRVNGIPMFTRSVRGSGAYLLDYTLTGNPLSQDYPLAASREAFSANSMENIRLNTMVEYLNIQQLLQEKEEEKKRYTITYVNGYPAISSSNLDQSSCSVVKMGKVQKLMEQLLKVLDYKGVAVKYGWSGDYNSMLTIVTNDTLVDPYLMINPDTILGKTDAELLAGLVYASIPLVYNIHNHYDDFCQKQAEVSGKVFQAILDGKIKLK